MPFMALSDTPAIKEVELAVKELRESTDRFNKSATILSVSMLVLAIIQTIALLLIDS